MLMRCLKKYVSFLYRYVAECWGKVYLGETFLEERVDFLGSNTTFLISLNMDLDEFFEYTQCALYFSHFFTDVFWIVKKNSSG